MRVLARQSPALLILLVSVSAGQEVSSSRSDSLLSVRVDFSRALDIYDWQLRASYTQALAPKTFFRFGENFLSSLHRLRDSDKWRDDQTATVGMEFPLFSSPAQARLYSRIFRDRISFLNSDHQSSGAELRLQRTLWRRFEIRPGAGYRWESRLEQVDNAPHFELGAFLPPSGWGEYTHRLDAYAATERFPSRKNEDVRFSYGLAREFYTDTSDSLFLNFIHYRRDNFVSEQGQIRVERLSKRTRGVENRLRYRVSENGRLGLRTLLQESVVGISKSQPDSSASRRDDFSSREYDDFQVQHVVTLDWQRQKFSTGFELRFDQQTVDNNSSGSTPFSSQFGIVRYNVKDRSFSIAQRSGWQVSKSDSLGFSGSAARFARDTSDKNRPDSYDNFRAKVSITHQHKFRPGLAVRWQLSGYADHLVYLKSAFSATNNWTRILQLAPQVLFRLNENVHGSQRFGVRAHYVTYDFDDFAGAPKSFSSRTFFANDSLAARLTSRSSATFYYTLEIEELGSLNWDEFTTRPQQKRTRHWLHMMFDHAASPRWRFSPGVSFYKQTQWNYETTPAGTLRRRAAALTSVGPFVRVAYERPPHALLYFQGRRQMVFSPGTRKQSQSYFNLTVQWSF
jgi:hypothetical protein